MRFQKQIKISLVLGVALFSSTTAQAYSSYLTDVNNSYGSSYPDCLICHGTAAGGTDKGITVYANQYRATHSAATIKLNDADGDGFTNGQEGALTADLNVASVNPFTIKLAAVTGADTALTNVAVLGDNAATEAAFAIADGGITLGSGTAILGNIKVTINNAAATLIFKAGGIDSTATVYAVDTAAKTNVALAATDWTTNADGSIVINALPAGLTFPADIVVEKAASSAAAPTVAGGAAVTGCMTGSTTLPMMVLALLSIGFLAKRKKFQVEEK